MKNLGFKYISERLKNELDIVQVARDLGVEVLRNGKQAWVIRSHLWVIRSHLWVIRSHPTTAIVQ